MQSNPSQDDFLQRAYELAQFAGKLGEVPVGALVVYQQEIIGIGFNQREMKKSVTAHAELVALEQAMDKRRSWRLPGCEVYVSLEPCLMCCAALSQARISRVIYGAQNQKTDRPSDLKFAFELEFVLHEASGQLLSAFFAAQRKLGLASRPTC
jgi:tRNA(adenine34) deaminase